MFIVNGIKKYVPNANRNSPHLQKTILFFLRTAFNGKILSMHAKKCWITMIRYSLNEISYSSLRACLDYALSSLGMIASSIFTDCGITFGNS